ncbi:Chromosome partition protein Smc [Nostoc sp. DSM 114161]|jgi:DUF2075 family protein|uniref:NAD(P)H-quinone oxidoreductase subunit 4 n=1 Tax=Nostoc sp. DSM 114161 TaxID=3440143 RepID=UPI0040465E9E
MKLFTSLKNLVAYSLVLLITVCSLLLAPPSVAASVDVAATQYLADATTQTQTITPEIIDDAIADYRSLKGKISKNQDLEIDDIKDILEVINVEINALVQGKKDLLAVDSAAPTQDIDDSIADYRSLKGKISKNQDLEIDEIKGILKLLNTRINGLVELKKA